MNLLLHDASQSSETRALRSRLPSHRPAPAYVLKGSRRLIKGRPLVLTEEQARQHLTELREGIAQGWYKITTEARVPFDIETMTPGELPLAPPLKAELDESLAKDTIFPTITNMTQNGDLPPPEEFAMPVEPPIAAIENPIEPVFPPRIGASEKQLEAPRPQGRRGRGR